MFKVYLDGIEQDEKDIININDIAQFTIIREDGFTSDEQIIREKTEMEIQFTGCTYTYIAEKILNDKCADILFRIEDGSLYFNGIIKTTSCELQQFEGVGKAKIKDDSFSGYIRDYMNIKVKTFYTRTRNCLELAPIIDSFEMKNTHDNDTDMVTIKAFDVLNLIQYLINFYTDNKIDVVSNYLTNNKYAITTGFNMHNFGTSADDIYPNLSLSDIFSELRKKLRIYMGVEYYNTGEPYLRIENEEYFFSNTIPLFTIDDIQPNSIQTYDTARNFNSIQIGSTETDAENIYYPQINYTAWNNEEYFGCGTCTGEKENELDLVSDYVIDSNIIYDALNAGASEYDLDSSIFMFNYSNSTGVNIGTRTLTGSEYYYNDTLRNDNVLANWIDYYGKCIAVQRTSKYGFLTIKNQYSPKINSGVTLCCGFDNIYFLNGTVYDNLSSLVDSTKTVTLCSPFTIADPVTYFECQEAGTYNLQAKIINIRQGEYDPGVSGANFELTNVTYRLKIEVYTDNTYTTLIDEYQDESLGNSGYTKTSLNVETGNISMAVGNVALVSFYLEDCPLSNPYDIPFPCDYASFELLSDDFGCESIEYNDQNSKPFILDFDYPLCFEDYQLAKENKNGYITVANNRYWIKELTYRHKRNSHLKLIGNETICS